MCPLDGTPWHRIRIPFLAFPMSLLDPMSIHRSQVASSYVWEAGQKRMIEEDCQAEDYRLMGSSGSNPRDLRVELLRSDPTFREMFLGSPKETVEGGKWARVTGRQLWVWGSAPRAVMALALDSTTQYEAHNIGRYTSRSLAGNTAGLPRFQWSFSSGLCHQFNGMGECGCRFIRRKGAAC
jgi:hypothetical protein